MPTVSQGKSKIFRHGKANTKYASIPSKVATDSSFPFKNGERVIVEIVGDTLVFRRAEKGASQERESETKEEATETV